MATITLISCTDDVVTLTLDDVTGLAVGEQILVFNTGYSKLDGNHVLTSIDGLEVTYNVNNQDNIAEFAPAAASVAGRVTWIDTTDVELFVGQVEAGTDEADYLEMVTDAANCWAFRARLQAGYKDSPTAIPCLAVKQGVVLYAGSLFRQKGSLDNFQSSHHLAHKISMAGTIEEI